MERLGDLTKRMQAQQKTADLFAFFHLLGKHNGDRGLNIAAVEADPLSRITPDVARVIKAAVAVGDTTTSGWASQLAYGALASEWVLAVSATTLLGKLDYIRVPFLAPSIVDSGNTLAGYVAQGAPIPMSPGAFTRTDAMQRKKIAALIPFADELFQSWGPAAQQNMQDLAARSVRLAADLAVLDPDKAATDEHPASLTNGIAAGQSTGSSAAQATADLKAMLQSLIDNGSDLSRVTIAMSPGSALHLSQLLTAGGALAFPNVGPRGGFIWTIPVVTSKAAKLLGSPAENVIAALDGERILVADDGEIGVSIAKFTSLQMSTAPAAGPTNTTSLFQTHTKALRLILYRNFQRAIDTAVAWFPVGY